MEIKKKYLEKYLHDIAVEQLVDEYVEKGYKVSKNENIGNFQADIVARKDKSVLILEIKSGKMTPEKKHKIQNLANYIQNQGDYKFLLVIATPPKEKKLEIFEIERLFEESFNLDLPNELDALSTHTRINGVSDIDIDEIEIDGEDIKIKGCGVVSVDFQFGSDGDDLRADGYLSEDSYPFDFNVSLRYNNRILEIDCIDNLKFNTDSY